MTSVARRAPSKKTATTTRKRTSKAPAPAARRHTGDRATAVVLAFMLGATAVLLLNQFGLADDLTVNLSSISDWLAEHRNKPEAPAARNAAADSDDEAPAEPDPAPDPEPAAPRPPVPAVKPPPRPNEIRESRRTAPPVAPPARPAEPPATARQPAAPAPPAQPATPAPAARSAAPEATAAGQTATAGALTPAARRARLADVVLPDGFSSEWSGGPAVLRVTANEIAVGRPESGRVALTFDGNWEAGPLVLLLERLAGLGVKATFFLTGDFAKRYPESCRQIAAGGHEVASHSTTHPDFTKLSDQKIIRELETAEQRLLPLVGDQFKPYLRPPYGARDNRTLRLLMRVGYLPVYWTVDTLDWQDGMTADKILQRVEAAGLRPGMIVLSHVGSKAGVDAVPRLVTAIRAAGLEPGTMSDVLAR